MSQDIYQILQTYLSQMSKTFVYYSLRSIFVQIFRLVSDNGVENKIVKVTCTHWVQRPGKWGMGSLGEEGR